MPIIKVPYGDASVRFSVEKEKLLGIFNPPEISSAPDEGLEIERALESPIGSTALSDLMKRGRTLAIAVDDVTRPTPCSKILPPLLSRVGKAGIRRDDIKIIAALGSHRKMTDEELKEKCGPEIFDGYEVINHGYDDPGELKFLQTRKIPIWINRHFLEADLKIGIGYVVPHCNAGWSGGSKIILPGLSGAETVAKMHLHGVNRVGSILGKTENPIRALMDFCAKKVGLNSVLNVVLKERSIVKAFYGDFIKSHRVGVRAARAAYGARIPRKADITISTAYPFDKYDFWQCDRAVASADMTTRRGGGIIVVSPFTEGVSATHPEFGKLLPYAPKDINEKLRKGEVDDMAAAAGAIHLASFRLTKKIGIVSDGIGPKKAEELGFAGFRTVDEALKTMSREIRPCEKITVLPEGGLVLPLLR
jgi:nickel-dependent lactate racemase